MSFRVTAHFDHGSCGLLRFQIANDSVDIADAEVTLVTPVFNHMAQLALTTLCLVAGMHVEKFPFKQS